MTRKQIDYVYETLCVELFTDSQEVGPARNYQFI